MLRGQNIVVYDLEIKRTIEQAGGWHAHDKMGISVLCAYDFREMKMRIFLEDNLQEFIDRVNEPKTILSGFNIIDFDNKVVRGSGYALKPDSELLIYDMLQESRMGALGKPRANVSGFKLDDHLRVMGLSMKTANGAMAPIWYQEAKLGKLIDYCCADATVECALFAKIWQHGQLANEHTKQGFKVKHPRELMGESSNNSENLPV